MVKIEEHIKEMELTKQHISNAKGKQRLQYIKHLHKLEKQLKQCNLYLKDSIAVNV